MLNIEAKLVEEIEQYCQLNEIIDVDVFCTNLLRIAFNTEKYGIINKRVNKTEVTPEMTPEVNKPIVITINKENTKNNPTIYDQNYE